MRFLGELTTEAKTKTEACNRMLDDPGRLRAIRNTGLLDTPREEAFDRLARLAAQILEVPLTIVSLVDSERQFFKADYGLGSPFKESRTLPIDASLCRYTLKGEPIISSNAADDPFLRVHPSVGPWGIVAIIVLPLINPDGYVLGTFCAIQPTPREWTALELDVMKELTASIMTEINLRERINRLKWEQNCRDTFVAALTHDLRTPLTSSRVQAELLARGHPELPAVQKGTRRIIDSLDRAARMIGDLLDASRINSGEPVPLKLQACELSSLAAEALAELSAVHPDRFVLRAEGDLCIQADPNALRRIIENLAANAAKYGEPGTPIQVQLERRAAAVVIHVRNRGRPIAAAQLETIFEAFRRAPDVELGPESGWGLGLPLVKGLTEAHGGTVSVVSGAEEGTCFTVTLPQPAPRRPPDDARPPATTSASA